MKLRTYDGMHERDALLAIDGGGKWVDAGEARHLIESLEARIAELEERLRQNHDLRELANQQRRLADLAEMESQPHSPAWIRAETVGSLPGELCGLCDALDHGCSHERVRCAACGTEGLQENWPFRCCSATEAARNHHEGA